ncbi:predicted protein [Postia placenta Mad-698-R]|nr:predicted protein [Postia placenta Mad-698-R]
MPKDISSTVKYQQLFRVKSPEQRRHHPYKQCERPCEPVPNTPVVVERLRKEVGERGERGISRKVTEFKEACLPPENSPKRGGRMTYGHPEGTVRFHFYQTFEINPNFLRKKT